jgi:hypothetical protein
MIHLKVMNQPDRKKVKTTYCEKEKLVPEARKKAGYHKSAHK